MSAAAADAPQVPQAPLMQNDEGLPSLPVAQRRFGCRGASPPHDHPHIYLDMGDAAREIRCPYCSTLYVYAPPQKGDTKK